MTMNMASIGHENEVRESLLPLNTVSLDHIPKKTGPPQNRDSPLLKRTNI